MRRTPCLIPVMLRFPPQAARQDAWGRLVKLASSGAELSTGVRLIKGESVLLSFELGGAACESILARVEHAQDDVDGHRLAELRFLDEVQRRDLARALTEILARS